MELILLLGGALAAILFVNWLHQQGQMRDLGRKADAVSARLQALKATGEEHGPEGVALRQEHERLCDLMERVETRRLL